MFSLSIDSRTSQAETATVATCLRGRRSPDMGHNVGQSESLAARCVR
jgi:hypothetical protein